MASTFEVKWVYPPNWDGALPQYGGWKRVILNLVGVVDTDTETRVRKLDIDSLQCSSGGVPVRTVVEWVQYNVQGTGEAKLEWERAGYPLICVMSGQGKFDWRKSGGNADPGSSGDITGDILFTSDASYNVTLSVRLKDD